MDTVCISAFVGSSIALLATLQVNRWLKRLALPCLVLGIAATVDMISTVAGSVAIGCIASLALQIIVVITTLAIPPPSDVIPLAEVRS